MAPLPFAASFDAVAFIVKMVRLANANPATAGLVPALGVCFNSCSWDPATKRIIQSIPYEHYRVGWYSPESIANAVEVQVLSRQLFVLPGTVERLANKRLVLRTVGNGQQHGPGVEKQLLFAEPLAEDTRPGETGK